MEATLEIQHNVDNPNTFRPAKINKESKYPLLSKPENKSFLEEFKKFAFGNKDLSYNKEIVLAFRVEQSKSERDKFKAKYEDISSTRKELSSNGKNLVNNIQNGNSLTIKDMETLNSFNRNHH